jgi:uncharacterized protein (UPF0332 family)
MKKRFDWCLKQAKGLKLIDRNENLMRVYLKKSRSALNMLNAAIEKQELEWILDTSYYAKYFAVYALFMKAGIKCEIHDCTVEALKILFVNEKIIPEDIYDELERSKTLRVDTLYYNKEIGKTAIMQRADIAGDFCLGIERIINQIKDEQIEAIRKNFLRLC